MEKAALLKLATDVRGDWEATIAELGMDGLERPGVTGEWRVRDVLAHCNGFDRWQIVQLRSAFSGEIPTDEELTGGINYPPNDDLSDDAMNAMFIEGTRDLPTSTILRHWHEVMSMREAWLSAATQQQLDALITADWHSGSKRIMRLASEIPSATEHTPAWKLIFDQIDHLKAHLEEVQKRIEQENQPGSS